MIRSSLRGFFAVCLGLALSTQARADEPSLGLPLLVEAQVGAFGGPLGTGLALLYHPHGWFSAGAGLGVDLDREGQVGGPNLRLGLFSRARLLRIDPLDLGIALNLSRGQYKQTRDYRSDYYVDSRMEWDWGSATRLDVGLAAEMPGSRFSVRLEGGPAFLLNSPTCHFENALQSSSGDCNSAAIPARYRLSPEPGRISPYLMFSINYRPGVVTPAEAAATPESKRWASGWTASNWIWSMLAADGLGVFVGGALGGLAYSAVQGSLHKTGDGAAGDREIAMGLIAVAGSVGYTVGAASGARIYGGATERSDGAWGGALLGSAIGTAAAVGIAAAVFKYTPQGEHDAAKGVATACVLVPLLPALGATLGYAISSSPPRPLAAARYDARNGITLGLPMVMMSRSDAVTTVSVPVAAGVF